MSNLSQNISIPPPPPTPTLCHTVNSSGRMGLYVDPYSCPCSGCRDYLAGNYETFEDQQAEEPGLSNRAPYSLPPPTRLNLERQTAEAKGGPAGTPPFTALSPSSTCDLSPTPTGPTLARRTNGGGISPPSSPRLPLRSNGGGISYALAPTPTGLGNWRELVSRFSGVSEETETPAPAPSPAATIPAEAWAQPHNGLCTCAPCSGEDPITGMSLDLKKDIMEELYGYLAILEKQRKMIDAKMDFYSFLFEDASLRLRTQQLSQKILKLKKLIDVLEGNTE